MKIDKHIEHIKQRKECERTNSCDECNSEICLSAELIKLLNELQWYREQDLIRKEDAIETILEAGEGTAIMYHEVTCNIIRSIPKVEYRGDDYED